MNDFNTYKEYTLKKINESGIIEHPFYHMFIEEIIHPDLYTSFNERNNHYSNYTTNRLQDNKSFVNHKYSIVNSPDPILKMFYKIFADKDIMTAFLKKFFINYNTFLDKISIHEHECEFVYTDANKFQDIHTDIPSKFISLVFYLPDSVPSEEDQLNNGTILYDNNLNRVCSARYLPNSVCIFAPHFQSYHGFHTTIKRNALVLFYVNRDLVKEDLKAPPPTKCLKEIVSFKNSILNKVKHYKLIEYKDKDIHQELNNCKINYNKGRVIINKNV